MATSTKNKDSQELKRASSLLKNEEKKRDDLFNKFAFHGGSLQDYIASCNRCKDLSFEKQKIKLKTKQLINC
jgi:hypothetical protein